MRVGARLDEVDGHGETSVLSGNVQRRVALILRYGQVSPPTEQDPGDARVALLDGIHERRPSFSGSPWSMLIDALESRAISSLRWNRGRPQRAAHSTAHEATAAGTELLRASQLEGAERDTGWIDSGA